MNTDLIDYTNVSQTKKPLIAYQIFNKEIFETLKRENPSASISEISKMVAAKWKQLSPEEKKKYSEKVKFLKLIRLIIY